MGINRNIVECKERQQRDPVQRVPVLIETLWNVKEKRERKVENAG